MKNRIKPVPKASRKPEGGTAAKIRNGQLQVASGDLKAADQPQAPPYAKSMGAVETAQIQLFLLIPNYKNRTASPHPIIVATPNQGCFCIDGWEMVEEAREQNLPSIVCEIIHVSSDSETEIALHKVAVRSMPLGGTCDYPETIRNTVLIFKMLIESGEKLEVFSHGGARRGTGFNKGREEDVITVLVQRLGKSRKTILKHLQHGEYLNEEALNAAVEDDVDKSSFEAVQQGKAALVSDLKAAKRSEAEIVEVVSAKMLVWLKEATTPVPNRIVQALERVAVETILENADRIAQHTRIFRYIQQRGLVEKLGNVRVNLADGSQNTLGRIRRASERSVSVYFGIAQKQALNQIMQAGGHIVVLLSADRHRQQAERTYLERYCAGKPFDGVIACQEHYTNLSRFEKVFLSELETNIAKAYEVTDFRLIPGKLTEDIPVYVKETVGSQPPEIFVDVRHKEIVKLEVLGYSQVLYSLIATFCREYLGPSLKRWSPRFFGDGALNLELLAKRRSEFWLLLKDDIGVVRKRGKRQVVTQSDVRVVTVGGGNQQQLEPPPGKQFPRLLLIDDQSTTGVGGYYIRLPDTAFMAYGDLLPECDSRGITWGGNKILYVASDTMSAAFQYEIVLDEIVSTTVNGVIRSEGALALDRPLQEMFGGLYFPIPGMLERFLIPRGQEEIRLQLNCDWFDMRTARHWAAKESET